MIGSGYVDSFQFFIGYNVSIYTFIGKMSRVNYNPQIFLTIFYYTLQFSKSIYPKVVLRMQRSSLVNNGRRVFMTLLFRHIRSIDIFSSWKYLNRSIIFQLFKKRRLKDSSNFVFRIGDNERERGRGRENRWNFTIWSSKRHQDLERTIGYSFVYRDRLPPRIESTSDEGNLSKGIRAN